MTRPVRFDGNLLHNLVLFGRVLRGVGLDVSPGRLVDVAGALDHIEIGRKGDFYHTLRGMLVLKREELPIFEQAFELFWRKPADEFALADLFKFRPQSGQEELPKEMPASLPQPPPPDLDQDEEEPEDTIIEVTRTYSTREVLRQKDFGDLTGDEIAAIKQIMAELIWQMGQRRTRRQKTGDGKQLDLRRAIRRNFRYGGEILEFPRREPKYKPRPLVIIADVSGSMERYSKLLLHFTYGLSTALSQRVEAFVFSTRLTRITRPLQDRDIDRALRETTKAIPDWSGGTRIGEALKRFNYDWGRRVLRGGATVLIISDGWDRGDPNLLGNEMKRLQLSCHRLIWLNPLLGSSNYEPLTRGIVAALPFIDDFMPVHNLASLEELARHLAKLSN